MSTENHDASQPGSGEPGPARCTHAPPCPPAEAADRDGAAVVADHHEQGWSLLCNGVVLFDDTGEVLPDGRIVAPHRPIGEHATSA
jgi:Family of unknown function (DUF5999)